MAYFIGNAAKVVLVVMSVVFFVRTSALRTSCGRDFCEHSNEYPISPAFQRNMENDPRFASLKGAPVPTSSSGMGDDDPDLPSDEGQYQICKSKSDVIFPQEAQNTRGQRKFIINFGPFVQGIAIERCQTDSFTLPCNYIGTPPGYQSMCVQKEMAHRLTTIETDPSTGSVSTSVDIFHFPSYCACKLVPGQRAGPLCAGFQQTPPPPPGVVYGMGTYNDDAGSSPDTKMLTFTSRSRLTPTTQARAALNSRTVDLFSSPSNGGSSARAWLLQ